MPDPITQALVQYDPSDITYFDNSVDAIRSGAALGRDLPPVSQYTIPPTLPVNPLSQLMTTGALLGNALPGFKEDISSGLREFAPQGWQLNLPPAIRSGVDKVKEGLGNLINVQASDTGLNLPITKPETGFFGDVNEQDYRAQVYEALSGMQTGNKELAELEEISAISPGIRERLKGWATRDVWVDPMQEAEESDYTYSFNDPVTHAKMLDNKVLHTIGKVINAGIEKAPSRVEEALKNVTFPFKEVPWVNKDIAEDLGAELGYDRSLTDAEYDALLHLTASAGQPHGGFSRLSVPMYENLDPTLERLSPNPNLTAFNIKGLSDFPEQAIQDAVNNMIGNEYWQMSQSTGEPVDVKKMFLDPRVVRNLNVGPDPVTPKTSLAEIQAMDPAERPSQLTALTQLIGVPDDDWSKADADRAEDLIKRYTTPGSQDLIDIVTQVESFSEPPVEWTPPAPVTKAVTGTPPKTGARGIAASPGATKTALENADKARKESLRVEEQKEEQRQQDAADRQSERDAKRVANQKSNAAKRAEKKKIAAEKKVQADFTAKVEKKKREDAAKAAKQMQEFMQWSAAEHKRHQEEQRLRELRGYGWGEMWT